MPLLEDEVVVARQYALNAETPCIIGCTLVHMLLLTAATFPVVPVSAIKVVAGSELLVWFVLGLLGL